MRSVRGISAAGIKACTSSAASRARCSPTAISSPVRSSVLMPVLSISAGYSSPDEPELTGALACPPFVTSEMRLRPARFNSPMTAMTRP